MPLFKKVFLVSIGGFLISSGFAFSMVSEKEAYLPCDSAKEYITTLEYLRKEKVFALKEEQARDLADKVSKGCSGAAARFIRVMDVLLKARMTSSDALKIALKSAPLEDRVVDSFVGVFREAYLKERFDLSLQASISLAEALSFDFKGDVDRAVADFRKLAKYCVESKKADLSRPVCAPLAVRVSRLSQKFDSEMAESFIELFEFLRSEKGPMQEVPQAVKLAEKMMKFGPEASTNFIQAYKYAIDRDGLELPKPGAVEFASRLASRSSKPPKTEHSKQVPVSR